MDISIRTSMCIFIHIFSVMLLILSLCRVFVKHDDMFCLGLYYIVGCNEDV